MILNQENGGRIRVMKETNATYQVVNVTRSGRADNSRPRILFGGDWLPEIGFVNGALIQTLPESKGIVFNLCNENIGNYSELYKSTKEKGGSLIKVCDCLDRARYRETGFVTTGNHIHKCGLQVGDALLAKCEYGRIRMRKVEGNVRLINVAKTKKAYTNEPVPMVLLLGDWLNEIGFTPDTLATVSATPGSIAFTAHNQSIIYSDVVKHARQNQMQLLQVGSKEGSPVITLTGQRIIKSGFSIGDIFYAEYKYGSIDLQQLDPGRFGFPEEDTTEAATPETGWS